MKTQKLILVILICIFLFANASAAQAHPADIYAHTINVTFTQAGLQIKWEVKPGPMLVPFLWNEADADQDGIITAQEADAWGHPHAALLTATLDNKPFPLQIDSISIPTDLQKFQAGDEFIVFNLSAKWAEDSANMHTLILNNGMEQKKSINLFKLSATDETAFLFPAQKNHVITIEFTQDRKLIVNQSTLLTSWDSGTPSMPVGQQKDVVTQTAEQVVPELSKRTPQEILLGFVRSDELSLSFYIFALGVSLALGALHALTPGHGKTIVAAYLVGSRGTAWHAAVLGSVVTLTHTGSVFALGLLTLTASRYFFTVDLLPFLELLSGLLIVLLGGGLLIPRVRDWRNSIEQNKVRAPSAQINMGDGRKRLVLNQPITEMEPPHKHDGAIPRMPQIGNPLAELSWRSLITLGVSGGLVPCPDAIAILLVAVAINRILLGLALIVSFSIGLAVILIVIGMLMVGGGRLFARMNFLNRLAPFMPVVSAAVVMILGVALTYGAVAKIGGRASSNAGTTARMEQARVIYLSEDVNADKQLFIKGVKSTDPKQLTFAAKGVVDYALAPDGTKVAYIEQTADLEYNLWTMNLDGSENKMIVPCSDAACNQPVWSPDGRRIIYEYMSLSEDSYGTTSLWWFDTTSGKTQPVFQESRLPGTNPRWSPDGAWLSYATPEGLRLYQFESGESRLIQNALGAAAQWAPGSKSILLRDVLIQRGQFITQLFLYDLDRQTLTNLNKKDSVENILAEWSPDGKWIAVVRRDLSIPRGDQLWIMRADGSDARALASPPAVLHGSLNWSPDGAYLLYDLYLLDSSPLESRLEIINTQTGEVTNLQINGYTPKWVW